MARIRQQEIKVKIVPEMAEVLKDLSAQVKAEQVESDHGAAFADAHQTASERDRTFDQNAIQCFARYTSNLAHAITWAGPLKIESVLSRGDEQPVLTWAEATQAAAQIISGALAGGQLRPLAREKEQMEWVWIGGVLIEGDSE